MFFCRGFLCLLVVVNRLRIGPEPASMPRISRLTCNLKTYPMSSMQNAEEFARRQFKTAEQDFPVIGMAAPLYLYNAQTAKQTDRYYHRVFFSVRLGPVADFSSILSKHCYLRICNIVDAI